MSTSKSNSSVRPNKKLNVFERYLSLWVALCMVAGRSVPKLVVDLRGLEFGRGSQINLPIAVLIWLMIIAMMMNIDFLSIRQVGTESERPAGHVICQLGG